MNELKKLHGNHCSISKALITEAAMPEKNMHSRVLDLWPAIEDPAADKAHSKDHSCAQKCKHEQHDCHKEQDHVQVDIHIPWLPVLMHVVVQRAIGPCGFLNNAC